MKTTLLKIKKFFSDNVMVLVCLIFLVIGTCFTTNFIAPKNLLSVLKQQSVVMMLAAGESIAILSGGIDASVGGLLCTSVVLLGLWQELPLPLLLLAVLLASALFGTISGTIISRFKVAPFVITTGMGTVGEGLALLLAEGRPIFITVESHKEWFRTIGTGKVGGVSTMFIVALVLLLIGQLILSKTSIGMHWRAIGGNENAAYWSGINTPLNKTLAYTFSGLMVGFGAILAVARTNVADPTVGVGLNVDAMSAAVLGGTYMGGGGVGSVIGALLGAFILGLINNLFNLINLSAYLQYVAQGVIIIIAVVLGSRSANKR